MFEDARANLLRDSEDTSLPIHVRRMAANLVESIDLYLRNRFPDARRRTDPAGNAAALIKPRST